MNKILITGAILIIIIGGGAFYGGMKYADSKRFSGSVFGGQNLQNLSPSERQQMMQQSRNSGGLGGRRGGAGGEFISGEIINKDGQSITVKLRDGGSKIIFLSGATSIGKTTEGTAGDLEAGKQVVVNGKANSDGSINAETIQIRPNMPASSQTNPQ